jgi:hypothetical protein
MIELEIQKFLRSDKTLSDLYQRFEIQNTISEDNTKVVFNYRLLSPLELKIVQESRALVLENNTWNVLSKAPDAFFAVDEDYSKDVLDNFDWASAKAMTKLDGALVTLYYHDNQWNVCTRYSPDGNIKVYSVNASKSDITWFELTQLCVQEMGYSWDEFTSKLNPDIFYTFELTSPENRVLVVYTDRKITLIAAIDRFSLKEIDIYDLEFPALKVPYKTISNLDDANNLILENNDPLVCEGFILIDKNFNRLKVRNSKFTQMLQFYSPQDELTALREIRMMDAISGYNTGSGSGSGSGSGGTASETGVVPFSVQSIINRVLILSKYLNDSWNEIQANPELADNHKINEIWPEALEYKKQGMSVSEILDKSSEEEILEALQRFEKEFN